VVSPSLRLPGKEKIAYDKRQARFLIFQQNAAVVINHLLPGGLRMKTQSKYRWFVVGVFFVFMLLHQTDRLLIGPLTTPIMAEFKINRAQMGFVTSGALLVNAIFYPIWGYLFDRYARAKLLALASFLWGATTWLSAIAPTYPAFVASRASTGVDDSSYPGLYSLVTDYFIPKVRGRVYGILELTAPLGYLLGTLLGLFLGGVIGWRGVFYLPAPVAADFGVRTCSGPERTGDIDQARHKIRLECRQRIVRQAQPAHPVHPGFFRSVSLECDYLLVFQLPGD
jgi:MFS family permease